MEVIQIDNQNKFEVKLSNGTYKIGEELITINDICNNKTILVDRIDNIKKIDEVKIIIGYESNKDNKPRLTPEEYLKEREELESKIFFDEDNNIISDDLDNEYNYKKWIREYTPVYKTITTESEPLKIGRIINCRLNTDNEYITSIYSITEKIDNTNDLDLCIYNQPSAWLGIVKNKMKELQIEYEEGIDYSKTNNRKVYGNSTHSCIEYVKFTNKFIFTGTRFIKPRLLKGTYEVLLERYNEDKKEIEEIIERNYNLHFNELSNDNTEVLNELYNKLNSISSLVAKVNVKINSYDDKKELLKSIILELLNKVHSCMEMYSKLKYK